MVTRRRSKPLPGVIDRRRRATCPKAWGFTLLEVLIAAVLLATLLVAIWGLYRMFASLYETGYVKTERAQLIRSLVQQLSEDLAATIQPPRQESQRAGSAVQGHA